MLRCVCAQAFDAHCGIFCFHAGIYTVYEQPAGSYMPRHPEMVATLLLCWRIIEI